MFRTRLEKPGSTSSPVLVSDCADQKVQLMLHFWVRNKAISGPIYFEYVEKIKKAFDSAGIEMPLKEMKLTMEPVQVGPELRAAG